MLVVLTTATLLTISVANACQEIKEFGCKPFVNCMPCEGGWCWIKGKKK